MSVCLLTSEPPHSPAGTRVARLAQQLDGGRVVVTARVDWPGAVHVDELGDQQFDAAVAFGWRTCLHLFRPSARGYAYFVPALEDAQLWQGEEDRLLAGLTYDLPVQLITETNALAAALTARSPGARVAVVPRGFEPPPEGRADAAGDKLRVAAGDSTAVVERLGDAVELRADADADVLLELNPPEYPLELAPGAMQLGCVPFVTPVPGHDELVEDGQSGVVVEFDDVPGAARALEALAHDRERLARLRAGALERAARLPTLSEWGRAFADVLDKLPAEPAPAGWARRLLLNARATAEPIANERRALERVLREQEAALAEAAERISRLEAEASERGRPFHRAKNALRRARRS